MTAKRSRKRALLAFVLVFLTAAAYEGVRHCGFLHYDDDIYVWRNPHLADGITPSTVRWAFAADLAHDSPHADYWAPLTVLSRLLDVQLFGMDPTGHHLTNLALHGLNVLLLFGVLHALTGALWRSAFVAGVLAVHPLHVESVAWITERKDVLSGVFWLLTIAAYARYTRAPSPGRMALTAVSLACGLMAKPMLVTLPLVLLLLDVWPLRRQDRTERRLVEKWPLFLLSSVSLLTSVATNAGRMQEAPPWPRVVNALHSYVAYLGDAFWPAGLGVGYPQVGSAPPLHVAYWLAVLVAITVAVVVAGRARPYLLVGWGWYLIALLPVIGLLQVGVHGRADRFVYLPLVGISLALAWLAGELGRTENGRRSLGAVGVLTLLLLAVLTHRQVAHWRDDLALFRHSVRVIPDSPIAYNGLARALSLQGDLEGAEAALREALRIRPDLVLVLRNLSELLQQRGRADEAAALLEGALRGDGVRGAFRRSELELALGLLRARQGRTEDAAKHYAAAADLVPTHWAPPYNWGNLLASQGRFKEAEPLFREARKRNPDHEDVLNNLGLTLLMQDRAAEAVALLSDAARAHPKSSLLRTSLGRALRAAGRPREALVELREAVRLDPRNADAQLELRAAREATGAEPRP